LRENIFSIIDYKIKGSSILDIFAGSGVCCIESLHKGARKASMIEINKDIAKKLYNTAHKKKVINYIKIYSGNVSKMIVKLHDLGNYYDIIFVDPPYNIRLKREFWKRLNTILCRDYTIIYRSNVYDRPSETGEVVIKRDGFFHIYRE